MRRSWPNKGYRYRVVHRRQKRAFDPSAHDPVELNNDLELYQTDDGADMVSFEKAGQEGAGHRGAAQGALCGGVAPA